MRQDEHRKPGFLTSVRQAAVTFEHSRMAASLDLGLGLCHASLMTQPQCIWGSTSAFSSLTVDFRLQLAEAGGEGLDVSCHTLSKIFLSLSLLAFACVIGTCS